jgi:hypothetical protein
MHKNKLQRFLKHFSRTLGMSAIFLIAGGMSFFLGVGSVNDVEPIEVTDAQAAQTTSLSIVLQYAPVSGGAPVPLVVTPVMNSSQTALVNLQEIHSGLVLPATVSDRCRSTNTTGRCIVANLPVGGVPESQYDIIVDTIFLEFLTRVPLQSQGAFVRFDRTQCSQTNFTISAGSTTTGWCLSKQGNAYAAEYTVTITLKERNTCTSSVPPAAFCDTDTRKIVEFSCNPSTTAATKPWAAVTSVCSSPVQCPDGNMVEGRCGRIGTSLSSCSTAFACTQNQLCSVQNFGTNLSYVAGKETIIIRGTHFGVAGGTVSFPVAGGGKETVQIFPGTDWTDTEIRVRVPISAISGPLDIHPNTHGFFSGQNGALTPAICVSPAASIQSFADQFAILSLNALSPNGVQLVSPGFTTNLSLIAQHNDNVGRFDSIVVELIQGAFPDPENLPLKRTVIAQAACPVTILGSTAVREATLNCSLPVPPSAGAFEGPFTFIVTLTDDAGGTERAVILDSGRSAMIGDFNFDHVLTIEDAVIGFRIARGTIPVQAAHLERDTNNDGAITMIDAFFVLHSLTR